MISGLSPVKRVSVTINGITHEGTYFVQNYMVHVVSSFGAKATQLGGSPPEAIAKLRRTDLGYGPRQLRCPNDFDAFIRKVQRGSRVNVASLPAYAYLDGMFKAFEFCLPTNATNVPAGPEWLHEIKHDGFRLRVERDGDRVRLITKGGYDWTKKYPSIVEAALKNRQKHFVIDGEAVILGVDGVR
jgi:hypothetical protein